MSVGGDSPMAVEVDNLIIATHGDLSLLFHGSMPAYPRAKLLITHSELADSAYDKKRDVIIVNVPLGNLNMPDTLRPDMWPVWKIDLVEEMLHEYQFKAVQHVSASAKTLHSQYWKKFYGPGHDQFFFAAIEAKAPCLQMTPEKLIAVLCGARP